MVQYDLPPTPGDIAGAALTGLAVATWYALPDVIRGRTPRVLARTGVLSLAAIGFWQLALREPEIDDGPDPAAVRPFPDWPKPVVVAGGVVTLAAGFLTTVAGEALIFQRGERGRQQGDRLAHTKQALLLGTVAGVTALVGSILEGWVREVQADQGAVESTEPAVEFIPGEDGLDY